MVDLALRAEVPLALDERELLVDGRQPLLRLDDDHAVHAVGDVVQGRRGAAVVHPDAGVVGGPLVELLLAGVDRGHLVVPGDLAGMEVDRVRELVGRRVLQVDADRVADLDPDDRARDRPAERPDALDEARGDGHLRLGDDEVDVVGVARRDAGRGRVVGDRRGRVRIRRDVVGRQRAAVVVRRGARDGLAAAVAPATVTEPVIPACGVTGDRAQERDAARRHVDLDGGACRPAGAWAVSPVGNVMSCGDLPGVLEGHGVAAGLVDGQRPSA